ncbi:hypothetical protein [Zavarzinia sp. CC-PAN008]|uniref:hypothetical protein n=1 Tax=Zavarzinia sp. CC-PAN008 TaxID=3243332 RepID=UPI003F748876
MADLGRTRLDRADVTVQRIWRLAPTERHSLHWLHSIYKGPVLVRAPNEAQARRAVARAFGLARPTRPLEAGQIPWLQADLATCDEQECDPACCTGPTRIIEPLDMIAARTLLRAAPLAAAAPGPGARAPLDETPRPDE